MATPLKSYIDRVLNVLSEIDDLGTDKKNIYKELADEGYDRTVVAQVVGHIRKKAKKPGKFAEQSALFDLYLADYEGTGTVVATRTPHASSEDFDRETGEILDTNTARETLASTTAADPAGEADDASSADQSTAARKDVPTAPDLDRPMQGAGTQAPPVDTHSEPEGASIGAKPSMASEPATEEAGPQPSSVVPGRQPGCLNPDTCAGTWRKRCASCERAFMAVAAGGQAIVHQGQVA
jgi:uncharacterized protein (UPF0335 family)